jgi:hypothetical protein
LESNRELRWPSRGSGLWLACARPDLLAGVLFLVLERK